MSLRRGVSGGEGHGTVHAVRAVVRAAMTPVIAAVTAVALSVTATITAGIQLAASTLLVMGGNDNPTGLTPTMQQQLGGDPWYPNPDPDWLRPVGVFGEGYIDTANNPGSPYFGWDFDRVEWPAQIGLPILGQWAYEPAQQQGVHNIDVAIAGVLPTLGPAEEAVAFGYSSSANVMVREMRGLQNQPGGAPATGQLEFFLMGNPNRPNGGIMQRFAGLYIPFLDIRLDGSTPVDTPYVTTDVSWEYDSAADFPLYPLNLLAVLNTVFAGRTLHGNYYPADVDGPRAFPDTTVGNITYITLEPPHLPLLLPLYYLGFPQPLLDLVEPALTVMVDWGYDRSISPGTPTTARLIPRINPVTAVIDLADAVAEGVHNFLEDLRPTNPAAAISAAAVPTARRADAVTVQRRTVSAAVSPAVVAAVSPAVGAAQAQRASGQADRRERDRQADRDRR